MFIPREKQKKKIFLDFRFFILLSDRCRHYFFFFVFSNIISNELLIEPNDSSSNQLTN